MGANENIVKTFELITPLGPDTLLFHELDVKEELGRLGEMNLLALSKQEDINPNDILGKRISVKFELTEGDFRYFTAYVIKFGLVGMQGRYYEYKAILKPWFWLLTRTKDCRIYQNKTVPQIIKEVFEEHSVAEYKLQLTENYRQRDYCVQYRESDFDFISRLMEEEGIYYYFEHGEKANMMILADGPAAHAIFKNYEQIPFIPKGTEVRSEIEYIDTWSCEREIQPGKYVMHDFDYEKPRVDLTTQKAYKMDHDLSEYEIFDYPGAYTARADGDKYAQVRIEELHAQHETVAGSGNARGIAVGYLFTLTKYPRSDQNKQYLIVSTHQKLKSAEYESNSTQNGAKYSCEFTALQSKQPFRSASITPIPTVLGPQTAMVVGPAGEEIYMDKAGRVKVQFHWDRYGKSDENSSCWLRVSQPWAGKGWGGVSTPRIGQEVIVDFMEGDPDLPIITGRVYNGEALQPHGGVVSGLKSQTHKGAGYNEMSMDDTAGDEKLTFHGQHNMSTTVGNDQTNLIKNNQSSTVINNKSNTVNGTFTETIKKNTNITVTEGNYTHDIATGTALYHVKAALTQNYDNNQTAEVLGIKTTTVTGQVNETYKANTKTHITGKKTVTVVGDHSDEATVNRYIKSPYVQVGDKKILVDGSDNITLQSEGYSIRIDPTQIVMGSGGNTIKIDAAGVTINGVLVKIN